MPIASIFTQPAVKSLNAAYRPIYYRLSATATDGTAIPPVLYCDVYINGIFYKTLSRTQYAKKNTTNTEWEFDIQDACQEYLQKHIGAIGGSALIVNTTSVISVYCKFRASKINNDGFTEYEGTEPIQATGSSPAVAGDGSMTTTFFVLNSALQHPDNQILESHLDSFKKRTWVTGFFPLSHRPDNYRLCKTDSDYFPIFDRDNAYVIAKLRLNYRLIGQSTYRNATVNVNQLSTANLILIPNGPRNLQPLFAGISFGDIEEYYIQVISTTDVVLATGTKSMLSKCCDDDKLRIHFVNYLGTVDAINVKLVTLENETSSESYEVPVKYPLTKSNHAINRFNIRSNTLYQTVCLDYDEKDNEWLSELFDSPAAWIEQPAIQSQPADYIPIVMLDKKTARQKEEERFINEVPVEFKLSHSKILLR